MTDAQNWVLVACAMVGALSLFYTAHFIEKLSRRADVIADLLRQLRNILDKN